MFGLRDKRIIISGGGSGIGLETARIVVSQGAKVGLIGRRTDLLEQVVAELGEGAASFPCDVSSEEAVSALADEVKADWGAIDGLVNNAGVAPMASLEETSSELWDETFAVNVRGPFLVCRAFAGLLREGSSPAVVNVSSTLAEKAIPGMAAYNASKAAVNQLTRSLALEWAPQIRVNAVMPAVVDTPIHSLRGMTSEDVAAMGAIHPMGRVGRPSDVALMIAFLLSSNTSWMTGTVIPVDGGIMAG